MKFFEALKKFFLLKKEGKDMDSEHVKKAVPKKTAAGRGGVGQPCPPAGIN